MFSVLFIFTQLFPQSIWRTLSGSGQSIDFEMFNYDGEYF